MAKTNDASDQAQSLPPRDPKREAGDIHVSLAALRKKTEKADLPGSPIAGFLSDDAGSRSSPSCPPDDKWSVPRKDEVFSVVRKELAPRPPLQGIEATRTAVSSQDAANKAFFSPLETTYAEESRGERFLEAKPMEQFILQRPSMADVPRNELLREFTQVQQPSFSLGPMRVREQSVVNGLAPSHLIQIRRTEIPIGQPVDRAILLPISPYRPHAFPHAVNMIATAMAGVIGLVLLPAVGYLLWVAMPWTADALGQWWDWLTGHLH